LSSITLSRTTEHTTRQVPHRVSAASRVMAPRMRSYRQPGRTSLPFSAPQPSSNTGRSVKTSDPVVALIWRTISLPGPRRVCSSALMTTRLSPPRVTSAPAALPSPSPKALHPVRSPKSSPALTPPTLPDLPRLNLLALHPAALSLEMVVLRPTPLLRPVLVLQSQGLALGATAVTHGATTEAGGLTSTLELLQYEFRQA
jgi:hypothetical protein